MFEKPTYEELEQRVRELEAAESERKWTGRALPVRFSAAAQSFIRGFMICFLLLNCLFTGQAHAQELPEELRQRNLVIAIDNDYPPQTFLNIDGQPTGIFVDIWRLWSKKTGKNVTFLGGNWSDSLANLKSGKADIHSGLFYSDTRAEWIGFSQPFYGVGSYLFSLRESHKIDEQRDLAGKKIGAMLGSFQEEYLRQEYPKVIVVTFSNREKMIRAVLDKRIDALLAEAPTMTAQLDRFGLTGQFHVGNSMFRKSFHAGVLKENSLLLLFVDKGFDAISEQELAEIEKGWIHDPKRQYFKSELAYVLDAIPALIWIAKDPECRVITGNRYVNDLFSVANDANVSQTAAKMGQAVKIIHLKPDGTELQAEELPMQQSIAREKAVRNVEFSYLFPDGRQVFAIGNAVPLFDEHGQIRGSVGAFLDITETKQASARLQKRTQMFLILAIGFVVVLGVMLIVLARMWQAAKRDKEALRESDERFRAAFDSAQDCVLIWDKEYNYLYANQAAIDHVGTTPDQVIGKNIRDGLGHVPEFMRLWMSRVDKVFETGEELRVQDEQEMLGRQYHTDSILTPIRGAVGKVISVCVVYRDITELKLAEEALRESEKQLNVRNRVADIFLTIPNDEMYGEVLQVALEAMGSPYGTFAYIDENGDRIVPSMTRDIWDKCKMPDKGIFFPRDEWDNALWAKCLIEKKSFSSNGPFKIPDGHMPIRRALATPIIHKGESIGDLMVGDKPTDYSKKDIDLLEAIADRIAPILHIRLLNERHEIEHNRVEEEKAELESRLQQAQKMEAMGTLAGGIAHDFNNLLMAIQGRTSIMLIEKDSSHPDIRHLKGIEDNVESAADLTRQLLGFARGGKYEVSSTDLNELIEKQNRMFGRTKKEITIHGRYEEDLWSVEVDRGQIEQVLLNLYVNAGQAMLGGGDLHLETENLTLDENYVKPFSVEPGKYVKISVTDTGVGMDKATQERIFEPFFTTKEIGRGTGLGLASAYGIIKNHSGFINVYSEKGLGTTFNIYLPASEKEAIEEEKPAGDTLRGTETVLFVDDEDMIIEVAEGLFEQLGYRVLTAKNGKEAIEIYEENKEHIDIVLLDMIMPDMSGSDTYDKMKKIDPDIKVLLSSGYSINGQATEIMDRGCNGFIQKPFKMKELSQKLRGILDDK